MNNFFGRELRCGTLLVSALTCASPILPQTTPAPQETAPLTAQQAAEMLNSLREVQATVRDLRVRLEAVSASQARSEAESEHLRHELEASAQRIQALEATGEHAPIAAEIHELSASEKVTDTTSQTRPLVELERGTQEQSVDKRIARLEENAELTNDKIADQYQSKVESGAKYRLRLSGIFLFNFFGTTGAVNNLDFPELARDRGNLQSDHSFGGSLRQSQLSIEGFGPDFAGAHTSASLRFDFAGNTLQEANGAIMGQVRLRTGVFRLDWSNTSLIAGQDALFFVPLTPSSLASLAVPTFSYSGNLWGWAPQLRLEHKFSLPSNTELHLAAGILNQLTGDVSAPGQDRAPSVGEQSGQPGYAAHLSLQRKTNAGTWSLGAGGYYGRQSWGFGRVVDSWASTIDLRLPVTRYSEFTATYYRGRAVGGFGGGVAQSVLFNGSPDLRSSSVRGLDSQGGWAQFTLKPVRDFRMNAALGQDNPFASQLRSALLVPSGYSEPVLKNQSWFVNGIYNLRSNILLSLEFRRFATHNLGPEGYFANNLNVSLGYLF